MTAALSELQPDTSSVGSSNASTHKAKVIKPRSHLVISESDSDASGSSDGEEQEDGSTPLERFLAAWGLEEHIHMYVNVGYSDNLEFYSIIQTDSKSNKSTWIH